MKPLSFLITNTNDIFRAGLASLLSKSGSNNTICFAGNETEIFSLLNVIKFDFICMDIDIHEQKTETLIKRIKIKFPLIKIILFSSYYNKSQLRPLIALGINSFLIKSVAFMEIQKVVEILNRKMFYISKEHCDLISEEPFGERKKSDYTDNLSHEILFLISHELTIKEISICLKLSEKAIEYHKSYLFKKIAAKNTVGLAIYAIISGIYFDSLLVEKFKDSIHCDRDSVSIPTKN